MKFVRAHLMGAVTQFDAALLHVIGPVKDMSLEGVPSEKLIGKFLKIKFNNLVSLYTNNYLNRI